MSEVEDFIYQFEGNQREIMLYFHSLLVTDLGLTNRIRYKIPFYYRNSWICYLNPFKNGAIELAFIRGNELSNVQGILEARHRKQISGMVFEKFDDIPYKEISEIIQEAILLDETVPYKSKRAIKP